MAFVRVKWAISSFFLALFLLSLLYRTSWNSGDVLTSLENDYSTSKANVPDTEGRPQETCSPGMCKCPDCTPWNSSHVLLGAPTRNFRDNLLPKKHYMTAWAIAGFSNEFIGIVNMLYLATISDRIPIVPPFAPSHHISRSAGVIPFGEIFNLTHLQDTLQKPILEWRDVKDLPPPEDSYALTSKEHVGCWSARNIDEPTPFIADNMLDHLGLDVSYTRLPNHVRKQEDEKEIHVVFSELAALTYPESPSNDPSDFPLMLSSPMDYKLSPDQHLACFDFLYFATSGRNSYEWERSWSPAWRMIGSNLPFAERMVSLGKDYLALSFEVSSSDIPPFIAVHARRGDFVGQCFDMPGECLPPLTAYWQQVQEIKEELLQKRGLAVHEVVIASDEKDPEFWAQVRSLGWRQIDHVAHKTQSTHGEWYPPLIDIVVQSMASGFVGTLDSTFSLISRRRVEEWNHGVTRMVRKGIW
ncbi:hypothetical protein BDQ17DRAFT_1369056 [Cyathus striatus]|nr:hypothetical protein BDQ17DRAFT_1369056 [Cyathus striatus]